MTRLWFLPSSTIRCTVAASPIGIAGISVFLPSITAYDPGLVNLSAEGLGGESGDLASDAASVSAADLSGLFSPLAPESEEEAHPAIAARMAAVRKAQGRTYRMAIAISSKGSSERDGDDTGI